MRFSGLIRITFLVIILSDLRGQTGLFIFEGQVKDSVTSSRIADAVITLKGTSQTVFTDKQGLFTVKSKSTECTIVVYQLGYQTREFKLKSGSPNIIKLLPLAFNLDEVVVSVEKYKVVQENNNTSFLGFEFYDNFIVALVSKAAGSGGNYIQLLSLNGDMLSEKKAPRNSERLFKDCLNNVQIISQDSVCQFYYNYNNIVFLPAYPLKDFYTSLYRCQLYTNGNYYFKDKYYRNLKDVYTYISENFSSKLNTLYTLADSNAIYSLNSDLDLQYFLAKRRKWGNPPWDVKTIKENIDKLRESEPLSSKYLNLFRPVESELFGIDSCIYVFDYTNKKSLWFNSNNQLYLKDSLKYSHVLKPHALIDHDFKKIYFLSNDNQSVLHEYSIDKKQLVAREKLEKFHFLNNLLIKGNVVYFLYKNKAKSIHNKLYIYRLPLK